MSRRKSPRKTMRIDGRRRKVRLGGGTYANPHQGRVSLNNKTAWDTYRKVILAWNKAALGTTTAEIARRVGCATGTAQKAVTLATFLGLVNKVPSKCGFDSTVATGGERELLEAFRDQGAGMQRRSTLPTMENIKLDITDEVKRIMKEQFPHLMSVDSAPTGTTARSARRGAKKKGRGRGSVTTPTDFIRRIQGGDTV